MFRIETVEAGTKVVGKNLLGKGLTGSLSLPERCFSTSLEAKRRQETAE